MKKMKGFPAGLCAAALAAVMLAGCGTSAQPTAAPAATAAPEAAADTAADLVFKNGEIQTMTAEDDVAQAVAVRDGVIVYVGDDAGAEAYVGTGTQVIDLNGQYMTPGFVDGHIHEPGTYLGAGDSLDLYSLGADLEAYKKALTDFVAANPDFEIYNVSSMDLKAFPDSNPTNGWLDEICADKPVAVTDMSHHGTLLNSRAIELCGITRDTADPPSGTIYHDENGELTGYFSDCGDIITGLPAFEYGEADYREAFTAFQAEANSYGLTAIDSGGADPVEWPALAAMEKDGSLSLRVSTNVFVDQSQESFDSTLALLTQCKADYESDWLKFHQVKFKVDGVPEGKSAYLLEPYAAGAEMPADYVSSPACTQEELNELVARWNAAGYQVQTHCMGDAAVNMALNAYENSVKVNGSGDYRNQITHVTLITDADKTRMGELGIIGGMQPLWFYYDPFFSPLEEQMFGTERFKTEYHIRDMEDAGIVMTGSNDYPVTYDFAPLHAMEAGVTQCSPYAGEEGLAEYTRNADQGVTPYEALEWYTVNGAYAMFMEDQIGTIEVGKQADLTVLGYNILTCEPQAISDAPVVYTVSNGRIVYQG
jgi:predicted amidohydrolase YtcJ